MMLTPFHVLIGCLCIFFGEISVQVFWKKIGLLILWLGCCRSYVCILDSKLLLIMWYTNIFPTSVFCHFTFLIIFFDAQKQLILRKFNLFFFIAYASGVISKNPLPNQMMGIQFHTVACGNPVVPAPFVEKTVHSPLNGLGTLVKINWP